MFKRLVSYLVCLIFSFSNLQYSQAQDFNINQLPVPGTMIGESAPFTPLALKGLIVNPQKPLEFQFIIDTGRGPQNTASIKDQANQLVKYFLAGLTIPEGDLWVNLSPYEKNRMLPEALGQTDLGRDLLAQDYILKQLTASLIYPEKDLGKEFWSRVYAKARQQFGTTNVPVNTFNKVWILPDQAQVYENVNAAYVTKSTLKVMLDEDYTALQKHMTAHNGADSIGSQIVRAIILPEIEKEVNTGKNFAPLRQIYQALILAKWYKETIQNSLLDAVYTNKNKIAGVNLDDPAVKEQIYDRYLQAYKKGAFNYIKKDITPDGQVVPRKYFSGGINRLEPAHVDTHGSAAMINTDGADVILVVGLIAADTIEKQAAMINILEDTGGNNSDQRASPESIVGQKYELAINHSADVLIDRQRIENIGYRGKVLFHKAIVFITSKGSPGPRRGVFYAVLGNGMVLKLKAEDILPAIQGNLGFFQTAYTDAINVYGMDIKDSEMTLTIFTRDHGRRNVTIDFDKLHEHIKSKYTPVLDQMPLLVNSQTIDNAKKMQNEAMTADIFDIGTVSLVTLGVSSIGVGLLCSIWQDMYLKRKIFHISEKIKSEVTKRKSELDEDSLAKLVAERIELEMELYFYITIHPELHGIPDKTHTALGFLKDGYNFRLKFVKEEGDQEQGYVDTGLIYYIMYKKASAVIEKGEKLTDHAMLQASKVVSKANPVEDGGIDLNQINVKQNGKTVKVQFDPAQLNALEQGGFAGFSFKIKSMNRISSPFQLLKLLSFSPSI